MDRNINRSFAPQGQNMGQVRPQMMMGNPPPGLPTPPQPTSLPVGQAYVAKPPQTFGPAKPKNPVGRPAGQMMAGHAMGRARQG